MEAEQHLAGFLYQKNAFVFSVSEVFHPDFVRISIAEIDFPAKLGGKVSGQSDLGSRFFYAVFIGADPMDVGGMGKHAPRVIFEFVPLLQKVIPAMITDFFD